MACPPETAFRAPLVERGRAYARYPHFRDASGIPDRCFEITRELVPQHDLARAAVVDGRLELSGEAYLGLMGGSTTVELRRWPRGGTLWFETTPLATPELRDRTMPYPMAGYRVAIDLRTAAGGRRLPAGTWRIHASIGNETIRRSVPIRAPRRGGKAGGNGAPLVAGGALRTNAAGDLRLRIGRATVMDRLFERVEAVYLVATRRIARVLSGTRVGRLIVMALERSRPGVGAGPGDD